MPRKRQLLLLLGLLPAFLTSRGQSVPLPSTFAALVQSLPSQPANATPQIARVLDDLVHKTDLVTLQQQLPALVADSESPSADLRRLALLVLFAVESRQQAGGTPDLNAKAMLVPYIDRLAPRLHDSDEGVAHMGFVVLHGLVYVHPAPPELVALAEAELKRPDATQPAHFDTPPPPPGSASAGGTASPRGRMRPPSVESALGPNMLWILLPAGAVIHRDPTTGFIEAQETPEIQAAVLAFLQRPDQTPASLGETAHAFALAGPQIVELNDQLLPLLDTEGMARASLLHWMSDLTFSPQAYAQARTRLQGIATEQAATPQERHMATQLLGCWTNDRHHPCVIDPN